MFTEKKIRTIIYTILTVLIIWLLVSRRTLQYLHPRMIIFQILAAEFFVALTIYNWVKLFKDKSPEKEHTVKWHTVIPFLFLFIIIISNPSSLSAEAKQNKSLQLGSIEQTVNSSSEEEMIVRELTPEEAETASENEQSSGIDETKYAEVKVLNEDNVVGGSIDMDSSSKGEQESIPEIPTDFLGIVSGMYDTPELFLGERVTLEGFVYRDETFDEDSIVLGRLLITCCVADASIAGLYIEPDNASDYVTDSWIRVEGTVITGQKYIPETDSYMEIYTLENMNIEEIEALNDPYLYWTY
jgi:putative membrane protein